MTPPSMIPKSCILSTGQFRYWEGGPKQAPAVLLLHSAVGDAEFSWSPIWDALAAEHRVIAPDMPGFGDSEAPDGISLATVASALRELLNQLGVTRGTVVGNSFGVSAAISLASLYPECVERLVLVNGIKLPSVPGSIRRSAAIPAGRPLDLEGVLSRWLQHQGDGARIVTTNSIPHPTNAINVAPLLTTAINELALT